MGEVVMDQDGIESFMGQLGVDAQTDVLAISISQAMEAEYMGEYKWSEFKKGCAALGCDSIASWTAVLPRLRQDLTNEAKYFALYKYAFNFAQEKGKRNVEVELACALWDLLIGPAKCQFLEQWKAFLNGKVERNELIVVTKDTWEQFYQLVKSTGGNIANFEDDGTWPVMIDEFVAGVQ